MLGAYKYQVNDMNDVYNNKKAYRTLQNSTSLAMKRAVAGLASCPTVLTVCRLKATSHVRKWTWPAI
jgi:hypothetical protein